MWGMRISDPDWKNLIFDTYVWFYYMFMKERI